VRLNRAPNKACLGQRQSFVRGQRLAEEITLDLSAARLLIELHLGFLFNTLCEDFHTQLLGDRDDAADNGRMPR